MFKLRPLIYVSQHIYLLKNAKILMSFPYTNNNLTISKQTQSTECLQMNGAVSKVNKKFISHLTRAKRTPSAAATVQVSHALPAVRFSCLLRVRGASLQDGAAAGKGFLCAPF